MIPFLQKRRCPKCQSTRAAALTRPVEPGDLMVCARCLTLLRSTLDQPEAVDVAELHGQEHVYGQLLIAAARAARDIEKARNN